MYLKESEQTEAMCENWGVRGMATWNGFSLVVPYFMGDTPIGANSPLSRGVSSLGLVPAGHSPRWQHTPCDLFSIGDSARSRCIYYCFPENKT